MFLPYGSSGNALPDSDNLPVFLAAPKGYDVDGTPNYPTAKLGDFGLAIATGDEDELYNPRHLRESGTPGYKAPVRMIDPSVRKNPSTTD